MLGLAPRRRLPLALFGLVFGVALGLLFFAAITNPNFMQKINPPPQQPPPTTKSGFTQFDLPRLVNGAPPYTATVSYNVTANSFVSGDLFGISATVSIPTNSHWLIYRIYIEPDNSEMYIPESVRIPNMRTTPTPSRIDLSKSNSSSIYGETWKGEGTALLTASGSFSAKVKMWLAPTVEYSQTAERYNPEGLKNFEIEFSTLSLDVPSIEIKSGELVKLQARQQALEDLNLSLTYFVLFFASLDFAILIFDHSIDDDKKRDQDRAKKAKKIQEKSKHEADEY